MCEALGVIPGTKTKTNLRDQNSPQAALPAHAPGPFCHTPPFPPAPHEPLSSSGFPSKGHFQMPRCAAGWPGCCASQLPAVPHLVLYLLLPSTCHCSLQPQGCQASLKALILCVWGSHSASGTFPGHTLHSRFQTLEMSFHSSYCLPGCCPPGSTTASRAGLGPNSTAPSPA